MIQLTAQHNPTSTLESSEKPSFVQNEPYEDQTDPVPLSWKLWTNSDPYRYALPKKGDHWEEVMKRVDCYDDAMCKGWREDIDTLLVFAGLFSAAVTAFLIESYKWLQQDSTSTNELLLQLSLLLRNTTISPNFSTVASSSESISGFAPSPLSIRVNVFWFSSLTLSLSTAIIGILCKQWLREYRSASATLSPKDALMLRQIRLEAFEKWRVVNILSSLPLLLQAALVLFFAGILDLLWSLNRIVALVLTCEIGAAMLFLSMTTIMPSFTIIFRSQRPCAYKSPQAWILYRTLLWILQSIHASSASFALRFKTTSPAKDWTAADRASDRFVSRQVSELAKPNDCIGKAMNWVYSEYRDNLSMTFHTLHCLEELEDDMLAIAINYPSEHPKSSYYIYNTLLKNLPWSKEHHIFTLELIIRDINSNSKDVSLQAAYFSHLYAELRFGSPTVNLDDELAQQIIHTIRFYFQNTVDGPAVTYTTIHDISYLLLCCWRDSSPSSRSYSLVCLDDLERALSKLPDRSSQAQYGFDFAWLIARAMEANEKPEVYDSLLRSGRVRKFFSFLDGLAATRPEDRDGMHSTRPSAWKQQKASLAMQAGLDADYFDRPPTGNSSDSHVDNVEDQMKEQPRLSTIAIDEETKAIESRILPGSGITSNGFEAIVPSA